MKYIISTNDAKKAINTIFECVKQHKDPQGNEIKTWDVKEINESKKVLIHTTNQWEKKGCLSLTSNDDNDKIIVKFHYWNTFPKEQRSGYDEHYILGRFTELLLVHFYGLYNNVTITK